MNLIGIIKKKKKKKKNNSRKKKQRMKLYTCVMSIFTIYSNFLLFT